MTFNVINFRYDIFAIKAMTLIFIYCFIYFNWNVSYEKYLCYEHVVLCIHGTSLINNIN
jgi:hypothetical protein